MQVLFISRDREADELRELATRRVRFVMRRLAWLVPRASIHLSDINGPRGGVDKRCQVKLVTESGATVVITALARDWRSALDNALPRATRMLLRLWQRARSERGHERRDMAYQR